MIDPRNRMSSPRQWYDPCANMAAVVPDDDRDLPVAPRWVMCCSAGSLSFVTWGDQTITLPVQAGDILSFVLIRRIRDTGTDVAPIFMGWD